MTQTSTEGGTAAFLTRAEFDEAPEALDEGVRQAINDVEHTVALLIATVNQASGFRIHAGSVATETCLWSAVGILDRPR